MESKKENNAVVAVRGQLGLTQIVARSERTLRFGCKLGRQQMKSLAQKFRVDPTRATTLTSGHAGVWLWGSKLDLE